MQPLQCVSQHHVSSPHALTHMATKRDNNHAAIARRSASTDCKTPYNYAHMHNDTLQNTKGEPIRARNDRSRARKTTPTQTPCNIHAAITVTTSHVTVPFVTTSVRHHFPRSPLP